MYHNIRQGDLRLNQSLLNLFLFRLPLLEEGISKIKSEEILGLINITNGMTATGKRILLVWGKIFATMIEETDNKTKRRTKKWA